MHEIRNPDGALVGVEFYEAERCYRVLRDADAAGDAWQVTVDGHPHAIRFPASAGETGADVRRRTLERVNEHGG